MSELTQAQLAQIGTRMLSDEFAEMHRDLIQCRKLLVTLLCDCHKTFVLPLDPQKHTLGCKYRTSMKAAT